MSVRSSTQTMGSPRADSFFPISVAESLDRTEDQMHAHMDKARSAFERMSKKATEAQAAKDKEIVELRKALALAEANLKALQTTSQEKVGALQLKIKAGEEREASLQQKLTSAQEVEKTMKSAVEELAKTTFGPNPQENPMFMAAKTRPGHEPRLGGWALMNRLAHFFDKARTVQFI